MRIVQTLVVAFALAAILIAVLWSQAIGGGVAIIGLITVVAYWLATNPPPSRGSGNPSAMRFGG